MCLNIGGNAGDKVEFSDVMLADANGNLSFSRWCKCKVQAEILDHVKGDKVIAYKQKRRKGFRKKIRSPYALYQNQNQRYRLINFKFIHFKTINL